MVTTAVRRAKSGGGNEHGGLEELLTQLYYDRADAAGFDPAAARLIDVAITMLASDEADRARLRFEFAAASGRHLH